MFYQKRLLQPFSKIATFATRITLYRVANLWQGIMATIRKRGKSFEVQIRLRGINETRTFTDRISAQEWSFLREMEIKNGRKSILRGKKLSDSLARYAETVTLTKKSAANELNRIRRLKKTWLASPTSRRPE